MGERIESEKVEPYMLVGGTVERVILDYPDGKQRITGLLIRAVFPTLKTQLYRVSCDGGMQSEGVGESK